MTDLCNVQVFGEHMALLVAAVPANCTRPQENVSGTHLCSSLQAPLTLAFLD